MTPAADGGAPWRLIETHDVPAAHAMGLDEALLRSVGAPPTLRLYSWEPDAISLGYFQAFEDVPAAADHPVVVRRLTGGGAIHHHRAELTFSVTLDANHPAYRGSVPDSYGRTHRAVARALEALGIVGARERGGSPCASDVAGTGMCFHESTPMDVCWPRGADGALAKGVGTAQRRTGGRILHHGSIKLGPSPLEAGVADVAGAGGRADRAAAARALVEAFRAEFGVELLAAAPAPHELAAAEDLGARYGRPDFVHRAPRRETRRRG